MIFESADNRYPTVEELVLCDLFRNIDLREMRGPSISVRFALNDKSTELINGRLFLSFFLPFVAVIQTRIEHFDVESVECGSATAGRFIEWLVQRGLLAMHTSIDATPNRVFMLTMPTIIFFLWLTFSVDTDHFLFLLHAIY